VDDLGTRGVKGGGGARLDAEPRKVWNAVDRVRGRFGSHSRAGGPTQADQRFCHPTPPVPRPSRVAGYQAARRSFGFRSDKPYVRELIARGVWAYDFGYMPVTPRENRYLRLRARLKLGAAASRYLRGRPNISGGVSVEDDWPRGPYLLVRLTRDRTRHTRALRRRARFPHHLRTVLVDISERQLNRVQDRIDWDAAETDGFFIATSAPNIESGMVELEVITRRTDARRYFRDRYGPHVRPKVIATERTSPGCAAIKGYRLSADGRSVTVFYESGGGAEFDHAELHETDERVEIGIVVQAPNGPRNADSRTAEHTVALAQPLGNRRVVNASDDKTVPARQR
jgi:hypothetical protein